MDKRAVLKRWMEENERGPAWVGKKIGYTREWISNVLHGHKPFSDKLAQALTERLGIQFKSDSRSKRTKQNRQPEKKRTT